MFKHEKFHGQCPDKKDPLKLRLVRPLYLTQSSFAYDLWEFHYNRGLKQFEINCLFDEGILSLLKAMGIFKYELSENHTIFIQETANVIKEINPQFITDKVRTYIEHIGNIHFTHNEIDYSIPSQTLTNEFLKHFPRPFKKEWLYNLPLYDKPILKDTKDSAFFAFKNTILKISANGLVEHNYQNLDNVALWEYQIIKHDFTYKKDRIHKKGAFELFVNNVCNQASDRKAALCSAIGYLLHNYFDATKGQAVILYDEVLTNSEHPGGGTGKGLIAKALQLLRFTTKIDGRSFRNDDKFKWEKVTPYTQLVWIDDIGANFKFDNLFSLLTDGWQIERKYASKFDIPIEKSPKALICSNTTLNNKGSSNARRQFTVELSDYYSKQIITVTETPIADEHGMLFSDEWTTADWDLFYSFMLECVQLYLTFALIQYHRINVERNLLLKNTSDDFFEFADDDSIPLNGPFEMKSLFTEFQRQYSGNENLAQRTFTNWVKTYCESKGYSFESAGKSNGIPKYVIREQGNNV